MVTGTARLIASIIATVLLVAGCQTTAGRAIDDASITTAVKTKLGAERLANLTEVNVDTKDGVVTLSGHVDTPAQKAKAEDIARKTGDVRSVVNRIAVEGAPAASPPPAR